MPRQITIRLTIPTLSDIRNKVRAYYAPANAPNWMLSRYASSLIIVTCGMSIGLLISRDYSSVGIVPGIESHTSFWRLMYALAFGLAGLVSIFYYVRSGALSKVWENRVRTAMFVLAIIPSVGWLLISAWIAFAYHGDWTRVVPWLFIVIYFGRAFNTPAATIEQTFVEEIRSHLPDS